MNPALRNRRCTPLGVILLALSLALALIASVAVAGPPVSMAAASSVQFLKNAKKFEHAALAELDGSHPAPSGPAQSPPAGPSAHARAQLTDLSWLAGRWIGKWGPRTAEQIWTSPRAGMMLGAFRLFEDHRTLLIEIFTLEQKPDGVELRFRHFTPDLVPWEKSAAIKLMLQAYDSNKWDFLNPTDGEPKRSIIIRVDADTYTLRSEISAGKAPMRVVDITFHRQGVPARKQRRK